MAACRPSLQSSNQKMNKSDNHDKDHPLPTDDDTDILLETLFSNVASLIRETPVTGELTQTSQADKLRMYGLYKHITHGCSTDSGDNSTIPSRFNMVARAKYDAWVQCSTLSRMEAQLAYVELAASQNHWLGQTCQQMLQEYYQNENNEKIKEPNFTTLEEVSLSAQSKSSTATAATLSIRPKSSTFLGIQPILPRGQLDISYSDLMYGIFQCLKRDSSTTNARYYHQEEQIQNLWLQQLQERNNSHHESTTTTTKNNNKPSLSPSVVVGLSVRSLLDLYLTSKSYPSQSEIIIVPPINVPGMVEVLLYHGLTVIPVDIPAASTDATTPQDEMSMSSSTNSSTIGVDIDAITNVISSKTVAIMVVHPFGYVCTSPQDMKCIHQVAQKHQLDILEDCAECFAGLAMSPKQNNKKENGKKILQSKDEDNDEDDVSYLGSPYATISFFSFGTIKTATALGGGIAILNNEDTTTTTTAIQMKRNQQSIYKHQTTKQYLWKLLKSIMFCVIVERPLLYGFIAMMCPFLGINFDTLVSNCIRGFPTNKHNSKKEQEQKKKRKQTKLTAQEQNQIEETRRRALIVQLRQRPSLPLLSLLYRRLLQSQKVSDSVRQRIDRCNVMTKLLQQQCASNITAACIPRKVVGDKGGKSYMTSNRNKFWLYPITVNDPQAVSRILFQKYGYDVPRGTSQLQYVKRMPSSPRASSVATTTTTTISRTEDFFDKILYLPVSLRSMSYKEMQHLACAVNLATMEVAATKRCPKGNGEKNMTLCEVCCDKTTETRWNPKRIAIIVACVILLDGVLLDFITVQSLPMLALWCFAVLLGVVVVIHLIRCHCADLYLNGSNAFAKYNSMLFSTSLSGQRSKENRKPSSTRSMAHDSPPGLGCQTTKALEMNELKIPQVKKTGSQVAPADDKALPTVFLTGATGFVGSLLLRELLLHREALCITGGVIVLCRSKGNKSASTRISELLEDPMYSMFSQKEKEDLVMVVEGDISQPKGGMNSKDWNRVCLETNVTHVFHCAAAVSFTQTLEDAASSNISSSLNMQHLTKCLTNKGAKFVHISTAFVHGDCTGTPESPLTEELFPLRKYDPLELYRSMLETQSYASSAMHDLGFPNTYTFSKSICEHLLSRDQDVDTLIIRPSIVGPAIQEPFEGWAGKMPSTIVAAGVLHLTWQWNLYSSGDQKAAVIPVDVVCRHVLSKAFGGSSSDTSTDHNLSESDTVDHSPPLSEEEGSYQKLSRLSESVSFSTITSSGEKSGSECNNFKIYNATWDASSDPSALFTWLDVAVVVSHLGSLLGYFSRFTACSTLFLNSILVPRMGVSLNTFRRLHYGLVQVPINLVISFFEIVGWVPPTVHQLSRLSTFLDLPLLFFPFMSKDFYFASDLIPPVDMDGDRYTFSCAVAAHNFMQQFFSKKKEKVSISKNVSERSNTQSLLLLGGREMKRSTSDFLWALSQPRGDYFIRFVGWVFRKILRGCTSQVTVDVASLSELALLRYPKSDKTQPYVILVPTHRSFFDFILVSFLCFSLPEVVDVAIPHIVAADDFSRLPLLGWAARAARAFFIRRGRGIADPALRKSVQRLKQTTGCDGTTCFEVFVEGTRSRDRRFIKAKTGFLRCLAESGGQHVVVPLTINYEKIPEQAVLSSHAERGIRSTVKSDGLFSWLTRVFSQKIDLGRIHIAASPPLRLDSSCEQNDVSTLAREIQLSHQDCVTVSAYHIAAGARALSLDIEVMEKALSILDSEFWPRLPNTCACSGSKNLDIPSSPSELWTVLLQYGHILAPLLSLSHPHWSRWLNPTILDVVAIDDASDPSLKSVSKALSKVFIAADNAVINAESLLQANGFKFLKAEHVLQIASENNPTIPLLLLRAAASMKMKLNDSPSKNELNLDFYLDIDTTQSLSDSSARENPSVDIPECQFRQHRSSWDKDEKLGSWGFHDSGFVLNWPSGGLRSVVMKGNRYGICGKPLLNLIPFIESETQIRVDPMKTTLPLMPRLPENRESKLSADNIMEVKASCFLVSDSVFDRARHGTGHSQDDMYAIRSGSLEQLRIPDLVVWPESEKEVEQLVSLCKDRNWCIIPYGGGTNVSHATRCPTIDVEPRPIISLDMREMNKILWVNEVDGIAHVEAGITGSALVNEMRGRGYTIGHEPDSIEFSTLGGWIATKASGMKRSKYGNIEDIVKDVRLVGSDGILWQGKENSQSAFARESRGIDLCSLAIGSEGCFGIITSATIRIWPLPEIIEYDSAIFPSFEYGVRFVRDISRLGQSMPSSVRLLDNEHFRLGRALQKKSSGLEGLCEDILTFAVKTAYSYAQDSAVCATITYEGNRDAVQQQKKLVKKLVSAHGGISTGSKTGRSGYELTFVIAYLRDFAMTYHFIGESFETFVPWSKLEEVSTCVKQRIREEHKKRHLPGLPFIGCRVTQLYHEGACLYFYLCMNVENVPNPSAFFSEIEHAARHEILEKGGSLSHHHGIGKLRAQFNEKMDSVTFRKGLSSLKKSLDPVNLFGARNGAFALPSVEGIS